MTLENVVRAGRVVIGTGCAYEVFALATGKPTLSKLCRHSKPFEAVFFGTLLVHFHLERQLLEKFDRKGSYARI